MNVFTRHYIIRNRRRRSQARLASLENDVIFCRYTQGVAALCPGLFSFAPLGLRSTGLALASQQASNSLFISLKGWENIAQGKAQRRPGFASAGNPKPRMGGPLGKDPFFFCHGITPRTQQGRVTRKKPSSAEIPIPSPQGRGTG